MRGIGYAFLVTFCAVGVTLFSLQGKAPITADNQNIILAILFIATILEALGKPFPYFTHLSIGTLFYFFILFLFGTGPAVFVTIGAVVFGTIIRIVMGEKRALLFCLIPISQVILTIGAFGLILELGISSFILPILEKFKGLIFIGVTYPFIDFMLSSMAANQLLYGDQFKNWTQERNRSLSLVALFPVIAYMGYLNYSTQNPWASVLLLSIVAMLLQFAAPTFAAEEKIREPIYDLLSEIDKYREKEKQIERKCEVYRKRLERKEEELLALMDFGRAWGTDLSLDNSMRVIFDMLRKLFRYQTCIIFSSAAVGEEAFFVTKKYSSPYGEYCKNLYIKFGETIVGRAAQERKPLLLINENNKEGIHRLLEYERSEMTVPLVIQDKVMWVLYIGQKEDKIYTSEDLQLFTLLAYQAAIFLVYAESYEATVSLATTDGLTGLYTHRYFQERLAEEVKRAERYRLPLSLVMIDVDHFKTYNDTYGHPKGDMLLKELSQILRYYTRETDVDCRYAGDEFSLVLIETSKENAVMIADRIRDAMVQRLNAEGTQVRITGSFGVASIPEDARNKSELIKKADEALYQAKKMRNKVVAYSPDMLEAAKVETQEKPKVQPEIKVLRKDWEKIKET